MKGKARDDTYFINKSSLVLPGPENSANISDFDPKRMTGFQFGKGPKLPDEKSTIPGPGHYDIPRTIGVIPPYARMKSSA